MTALLSPSEPRLSDEELLTARVARPRRTGQWLAGAVAAVLLAMLVHTVLTNPRFQWDVVGQFFTSSAILHGLVLTLWLTAAVMVCGYLLGTALAAMRLSRNVVLRSASFGYVWLIRSIPPLVLLLFWYELASLYPQLSLGVPFGPAVVTVRTAHLFTGIVAAFVALTLDVAAFSAEIVRGGLLAVPAGQTEAAQALGLGRWRIFRRIVLPQAMPAVVPASGNMLISMLKATSIVSVIAVQDLLYSAQLIYNQNFQVIPLLLVATLWYVVLTTILSIGQYYVERYYARGTKRSFGRITPWQPDPVPPWRCGVTAPLVHVRGLAKSFGSHRVLEGVDLDVTAGEVVVMLGPSGSGKSTPCCAVSTTWSGRTPASSSSTAS